MKFLVVQFPESIYCFLKLTYEYSDHVTDSGAPMRQQAKLRF
jgi:hypothetical protein